MASRPNTTASTASCRGRSSRSVDEILAQTHAADARGGEEAPVDPVAELQWSDRPLAEVIARLEAEMLREARALRFENAASLRDRIEELRARDAVQS